MSCIHQESVSFATKPKQMATPVFRISKLSCSYNHKEEDRVLYIEDLEIPKGKIVFLLGASGSGKSTLLETLGLMNDTFADGSIEFCPEEGSSIRLEDLWYQNKSDKLAEIRKKHYSFIFQNTNLMEHFTAYENICIAPMIQSGEAFSKWIEDAKSLMAKVNIPETQVDLSTLSLHLSGGQKQRVTFVRALMSNHTVLFCDEPTGNLDERNARELMNIITESVGENKSAIIVSHDIRLALEFADMIICISKEPGDTSSTIVPHNIFRRHQWESLDKEGLLKFKGRVLEAYDKVTDLYKNSQVTRNHSAVNAALKFTKMFRKKESKILSGKSKRNTAIITSLLLFTFIALGFANGAQKYLNEKLRNPFVKWLTMSVPASRSGEEAKDIIKQLNADSVRKEMHISSVSGFSEWSLKFSHHTNGMNRTVRGRTIKPQTDKILMDIFDPENMTGDSIRDTKDMGIICSRKFMDDLGYPDTTRFVQMVYPISIAGTDSIVRMKVPLAVRAIVKELPGKYEFLVTDYFYNAYKMVDSPFNVTIKDEIRFLVQSDQTKADELRQLALTELTSALGDSGRFEVREIAKHEYSRAQGYDIIVDFYDGKIPGSAIYELGEKILSLPEFAKLNEGVMRYYSFSSFDQDFPSVGSFSGISINLKDLSKVRDLKDYVFNAFNDDRTSAFIEIDITKVREKENFFFMANITLVISWMLVFFATLSISLFLYNLLKMHFAKIKQTLGTFMAFGLDNKRVRGIYISIVVKFLIIATIIAFGVAFGAGYLLNIAIAEFIPMEDKVSYFELLHINTLITVIALILTALAVAWLTVRNIMSRTPGDLIYKRDEG
jgi:ABC-type lipoprotein export system ATPase subunit